MYVKKKEKIYIGGHRGTLRTRNKGLALHIKRILVELLPHSAIEMIKEAKTSIEIKTQRDAEWLNHARAMGLIRNLADNHILQFNHILYRDYFVAKQLVKDMETGEVTDIIDKYLRDIPHEEWLFWEEVMKILTGFLKDSQLKDLIKHLYKINPLLALQCLHEIPEGIDSHRSVIVETADRIKFNINPMLESRIESAEALNFLDPRIIAIVDNPLKGTILVDSIKDLSSFKIGKYLVTNMEFAKFVQDG
ncbi:MAG: hypothetical protein ACMUIU_11550 [bacterium]